MCMKGIMAGEFLPTELQQIFDEAAVQAVRFWQATTISVRGYTVLHRCPLLESHIMGPVGENMRRFRRTLQQISGPYRVAMGCHGRLELRTLGFAPDGLAGADLGHGPRACGGGGGGYRHVFGRRRMNSLFLWFTARRQHRSFIR